ncbi:MAG: hypothetical protein FJ110_13885 [Deltaproteobacteria bacterium]|nr:hypothetical protein [Deltaproteobacteria bacterium]
MLLFLQLILTVIAIYVAVTHEEETRLIIPLACLVLMFIIGRLERTSSEKEMARKEFLKSEIDKFSHKDSTTIKEQDFFTIETLLWPKNELLLLDTIHAIFKDLGFAITPGIQYHSVDRIIKVPNTQRSFGLQVMMYEEEADRAHPKITRLLQFEKEKKEGEKSIIVASTHVRLTLADREKAAHISKELTDFLVQYNVSFITAHHLYGLWQKAKRGEIDIFAFFQKIYSHRGDLSPQKRTLDFLSPSPDLPIQ